MLLFLISFLFSVEPSSEWELLSTVEVVMGYDDFMGAEVEKPKFSEQLKNREGTSVVLEGFIIPLDQETEQDYFVLSRFPYASCFFCGAAGPETVAEIYSAEKFSFTDEKIRVQGKLRLNNNDPLHLFYVLDDASVEAMSD